MRNSLCLSFGEYFVEASLKGPEAVKSSRWPATKGSLSKNLTEFLGGQETSPDRIVIYLPLLSSILAKNRGATPAFITTVGFENWLEFNLPRQSTQFSPHPLRVQAPIDRNLCFGVSERINAQGEVVKKFDTEEIEFLASKLKMNDVEWIAVGLLHSDKNKSHEEEIADILQKQGFKTICSSQFKGASELDRWWMAVVAASLGPVVAGKVKDLEETLTALNIKPEIFFGTQHGLISGDVGLRGVDLLQGPSSVMQAWSKSRSIDSTLWFDLEGFFLSHRDEPESTTFTGISPSNWTRLQLQPLSAIVPHWLGDIDILGQEISFEPGPMSLGKGLKPCYLDCLTLLERHPIEGYSHLIVDKALPRLQENFSVLSRGLATKEHRSHRQWTTHLVDLGMQQMLREILVHSEASAKQLALFGALESYFRQPLQDFFKTQSMTIKTGPAFLSELALEVH